jgi:hypothetical protein
VAGWIWGYRRYEDITMEAPEQVPIWIGPAQEADSANACSLAWPELRPLAKCPPPLATVRWTNVTLRNVRVRNATESPGLVFGNNASAMEVRHPPPPPFFPYPSWVPLAYLWGI